MEAKKSPKAKLENYSKIFTEIGLLLALFIVYNFVELKTYDREVENLSQVVLEKEIKEDIPIVNPVKLTPPPPPQKQIIPQKVLVVDNQEKVEEIIIKSTETDETEAVEYVAPIEDIEEIEEEEVVVEDVPFVIIEKVPVFPGCKGNRTEMKNCFSKSLQLFFQKKFDPNLANELGLAPGKKRIIVFFKIDKNGDVADVMARAPHPRLKKEAIEIISALPKMKPGEQRGTKVGVKYTLPINFLVQ